MIRRNWRQEGCPIRLKFEVDCTRSRRHTQQRGPIHTTPSLDERRSISRSPEDAPPAASFRSTHSDQPLGLNSLLTAQDRLTKRHLPRSRATSALSRCSMKYARSASYSRCRVCSGTRKTGQDRLCRSVRLSSKTRTTSNDHGQMDEADDSLFCAGCL